MDKITYAVKEQDQVHSSLITILPASDYTEHRGLVAHIEFKCPNCGSWARTMCDADRDEFFAMKAPGLPFGWQIRKVVVCKHQWTYEVWFEGKFMDDFGSRKEAEEFIAEWDACRPETDETKIQ